LRLPLDGLLILYTEEYQCIAVRARIRSAAARAWIVRVGRTSTATASTTAAVVAGVKRLRTSTAVAWLGAIAYPGSKRMILPSHACRRPRPCVAGVAGLLWLIVIAKIACLSRLLNVNVVRILSRGVDALPVRVLTALAAEFVLMPLLVGHDTHYRLFARHQ
jgi:hypothetical protein